ncbi:MAG: helix-turn-helix domain-containing protein [Geobacteraceae bacterium]|nr:helix-turn-helix domain-containing protein [Geobacteraceae bacterium]
MQDKNIAHARFIMDSLRGHYGLKTYGKLAELLGVKQNTISTWISRGSFDVDLIYRKCDGINFHWLETGEGEMFTARAAEESAQYSSLAEPVAKALELFQKYPDKAWEFYAAILERAENAEKRKK